MATEAKIKELKTALESITQYQGEELISRSEWGAIDFEKAREDIEQVLSIAADLSELPLNHLTDTVIGRIIPQIEPVANHLNDIDEFTLTGDVEGTRDTLATGLHTAVEKFHAHTTPHIPYLAYKRGDISTNIAALNSAVDQAEKALEAAKKDITAKSERIDKIISAAQDAAVSVGVATFTQAFDDEATDLKDRSIKWLVGTALFALATMGAAIGLYFWPEPPPNAEGWETFRNIVSKAAMIAVLFTGTVWCGRIYRALMHQATVNRHRALSLKTFQAFVEATKDDRIKDSVLMAATRTVFGSVPTGLVDESGTQRDSGVQFVEIGKSAAENMAEAASQ